MLRIPNFSNCRLLVLGDVMLDQYFWGEVNRVSPEAPVPVVHLTSKTDSTGGAGNVALNLSGLGCRTHLIGIRGDDLPGKYLVQILAQNRIDCHLVVSPNHPTTTKTRIIGQGQQLLRLDEEKPEKITSNLQTAVMERLEILLPQMDAVILSDYGKGIFLGDLAENVIQRCRQAHIPIFVDPKGLNWQRYHGATCVTPNEKEFNLVAPDMESNDGDMVASARELRRRFDLKWLLITRGSKGLILFGHADDGICIPAKAREVFDVSGAGDTVIASLAASSACGLSMAEAAQVANRAAGIVVAKIGTSPVQLQELKRAVAAEVIKGTDKIVDRQTAMEILAHWRREKREVVFTNGCFDILHIGHIKLLNAAADQGSRLIVGLNSDASVRRLKGDERPIITQTERAALLASIECVDLVVIFEEDTPIKLVQAFKPEVIVKGGDYRPETVVGHEIVEANGGRVVIVPLVEGASTTGMLDQIKKNGDS
jgi:D-beta-D-heptose 7-phosphate kinase/D-beta-D-heptose 1-phosphate adenosyltransferase